MNNPYFGWELLNKLIECDIGGPEDLIVALVHWQLVQLGFSCLGVGDEKLIRDTDCGTEKLPDGWNDTPGYYSLRYALGQDLYILKGVIIDSSTALFNLYNVAKTTVSNVSFELRDVMTYCSSDTTSKRKLTDLMPRVDVHIARIREALVMPVAGCVDCSNETTNKPPDPCPIPRIPGEFQCVPNLSCAWPPGMGFEMPNRGLLVPVGKQPCLQNQGGFPGDQNPIMDQEFQRWGEAGANAAGNCGCVMEPS